MLLNEIGQLKKMSGKRPKYIYLAEHLRHWISQKKIPAGTKLPNNRQLAEFFKVTPVTINRSLKELAGKGIVDMKVGAGTFVSNNGRKLNKVLRIGVLCHETPGQNDYYISTVMNTFHQFWSNYPSDVILLKKTSKEYRKAIEEYSLDGVMILVPEEESTAETAALFAEGYPIVSIGVKVENLRGCSFGTDHFQTAQKAVHYLAQMGHKNIGILLLPTLDFSSKQRLEGYRDGMWNEKLLSNPKWIISETARKELGLKKAFSEIFDSNAPITSLLLASHGDIIPVYSTLNQLGLKIPEDISLIGFDNPNYSQHLTPPLTVMAQPVAEITENAAQSLLNQIEHKIGGETKEYEAYLIERDSVKKL